MAFLRDQMMEMLLQASPTKVLLLTNDKSLTEEVIDQCGELPVIVFTNNNPPTASLMRPTIRWKKLPKPPLPGIDVLRQVKDLIVSASADGTLRSQDRLLCVIATDIESAMVFDVQKTGVSGMRDVLPPQMNIEVLERATAIAIQIAREGREGYPAGALLVVGDSERVLLNSEETIRNPFSGGNEGNASVLDEGNWNTIKNFAVLDGALIINNQGFAVAAGRYLMLKGVRHLGVQEGLGGRHLAGASITTITKSVAIVVSTTGTVRMYKGGEEVYRIKAV